MEDEFLPPTLPEINCLHKCGPAFELANIQKRLGSLEEIVAKLVTCTNLNLSLSESQNGKDFDCVQQNINEESNNGEKRLKDLDPNKLEISSISSNNNQNGGSVAKKSTGGFKKRKISILTAGNDLSSELTDGDKNESQLGIDIKPEPLEYGWEANDNELGDFVLSPDVPQADRVEDNVSFQEAADLNFHFHPPKDDEGKHLEKIIPISSATTQKASLPNPYISLGPKCPQTQHQPKSQTPFSFVRSRRWFCCLRKLGICKKKLATLQHGTRVGQHSFRPQFNSFLEQQFEGIATNYFQDDEYVCSTHSIRVKAFANPKFRTKKIIPSPSPSIDLNAPRASRTRSKILQKGSNVLVNEPKMEFETETEFDGGNDPSFIPEDHEKSEECPNSEEFEMPEKQEKLKSKKSVKSPKKHRIQFISSSRKGRYQCTMENCYFRIDKQYKLDFHLRNHIIVRPYLCETCGRSFGRRDHLKSHVQVHNKKKVKPSFKCQVCSEGFHRPESLSKHVNEKHKDQRRRCDICNGVYASKTSLYVHKRKMHNNSNIGGMCDLCGKVIKDPKSLQNHIELHANPNFVPRAAKSPQKPYILSQDEDLVLDLDKIYDVPPGFVCDKEGCKWIGKKFSTKLLYRYHINKHHLVGEEKKVKCSLCNSVLKDISCLTYHMQNVHTTKRPHVCHICGQAFKQVQHLRRHVAGHSKPGWKPRKNSMKPYENKNQPDLATIVNNLEANGNKIDQVPEPLPSSMEPSKSNEEVEKAVESII